MTNTYIALTVGPIYRTLEAAKRTRMLWGTSYLFSYLIKELVKKIIEQGINPESFLIPNISKINEDNSSNYGAGIYPDRFVFKSKEGDLEKVSIAISTLLEQIADSIANHLKDSTEFGDLYKNYNTNQLELGIRNQLSEYLQFYFVQKEISEGELILKPLYDELDYLELYQKHILNIETNHLMNFLFRVSFHSPNTKLLSFLSDDAFGKGEKQNFTSLVEVSTKGLRNNVNSSEKYDENVKLFLENFETDLHSPSGREKTAEEDFENLFLNALKQDFKEDFRNHHKYVAVLYADGDGIGNLLEKIGASPDEIKAFSEKLIVFCKKAAKIINDFGGLPVYLGGEDIFAFLPVKSNGSLFNVIKSLDEEFESLFDNFEPIEKGIIVKPTLSYGISINYYRSPHFESIKAARDLMYQAKKTKGKNTIGIKVEKHSGQYFNTFIEKKNKDSYQLIIKLIGESIQDGNIKKNRIFINSITQKIKDDIFWTLLHTVGSDKHRLAAFFDNNFNEPIFKEHPISQYLMDLQKLILSVFVDYLEEKKRKEVLYFTLRFIDFINSKDER